MAVRAAAAARASLPGDSVETCFSHSAARFSSRAGFLGPTSITSLVVRFRVASLPPSSVTEP
jgi:hypothetical protein